MPARRWPPWALPAPLHVVNHALFKSLLFLGAGSVLHATGTREIDCLGGLLKRMPATGLTFLVGSAAISGLPPLNGFVSELMIYLGVLSGLCDAGRSPAVSWALLGVLAIGSLALIGGAATACFTRAIGVVFLGEPRTAAAAAAHESGLAMRIPMWILAAACIMVGLTAAPLWPLALSPAVKVLVPPAARVMPERALPLPEAAPLQGEGVFSMAGTLCNPHERTLDHPRRRRRSLGLDRGMMPLAAVSLGSYILVGLVVLLAHIRRKLLRGRTIEQAVTWGCGYVAPTPRMQYTASSFARPLTLLFRLFLQPRDEIHPPHGLFPKHAALHTHTPDLFRRYVYEPCSWALPGWPRSCDGCRRGGFRSTCSTSP